LAVTTRGSKLEILETNRVRFESDCANENIVIFKIKKDKREKNA